MPERRDRASKYRAQQGPGGFASQPRCALRLQFHVAGIEKELLEAVAATKARVAFDAIGGDKMAGQILNAMHVAASRNLATYSPYGSLKHKQLYFYGNLDFGPTVINRTLGIAWGIAGWAIPTFIEKIGPVEANKLKARVAAAITTTFASHFSKEISLGEAIAPENVAAYTKLATGEKYLVNPTR